MQCPPVLKTFSQVSGSSNAGRWEYEGSEFGNGLVMLWGCWDVMADEALLEEVSY